MTETLLKFEHVKKSFEETRVIQDMNLEVHIGEILVLVGESGSGKTTTLKMINRLEEPNDGKIYYQGKLITEYDKRHLRWDMGYVLQDIALFPTMTVAQNIAVLPEMKKMPKEETKTATEELLKEVGLNPAEYLNKLPSELSGGEQQRIGIIRAAIAKPALVLMDEPFSALDPLSRTALQDLVLKLQSVLKTTIVFVTHDMGEALKMGDRIAIMKDGELLQVDTPEQIAQHPKNDFVASFFKAARAKDIYDVYLGRIGMAGYYYQDAGTDDVVELDQEATVRDGMAVLKDHEELGITSADGQTKGYLNKTSLISYLSDHEKA